MKLLTLVLLLEITAQAQSTTITNNDLGKRLTPIEQPGVAAKILKEKEWEFHPVGGYELGALSVSSKGDPTHGPYGELKSTPLPPHYEWSYTTFYSPWNSPCGYAPCTVSNTQPRNYDRTEGNFNRNHRKR